MEADFPFARSLIVVRSERTIKKQNKTTSENRFYLSSHLPDRYTPAQWSSIIRGHWAGVEIRNHWKRDVGMGEDRSRTRNAGALANLALIRNALLALLAENLPGRSWPEIKEQFQKDSSASLKLVAA